MDIVITKNNFHTLVDVFIVNSTRIDLVQHASTMTMHVMIVAAQNKAQSYTKQVLGNDFIPLAVKTYSCFHLHFDSFLTSYVHECIAHHQQTSLVLLMFIFHYRQQVLIALQRA
jgi:hypothetical protein